MSKILIFIMAFITLWLFRLENIKQDYWDCLIDNNKLRNEITCLQKDIQNLRNEIRSK
jgi:hypothetical protein